jgi:hypothetical protein
VYADIEVELINQYWAFPKEDRHTAQLLPIASRQQNKRHQQVSFRTTQASTVLEAYVHLAPTLKPPSCAGETMQTCQLQPSLRKLGQILSTSHHLLGDSKWLRALATALWSLAARA